LYQKFLKLESDASFLLELERHEKEAELFLDTFSLSIFLAITESYGFFKRSLMVFCLIFEEFA
jgi:hypothetical protein